MSSLVATERGVGVMGDGLDTYQATFSNTSSLGYEAALTALASDPGAVDYIVIRVKASAGWDVVGGLSVDADFLKWRIGTGTFSTPVAVSIAKGTPGVTPEWFESGQLTTTPTGGAWNKAALDGLAVTTYTTLGPRPPLAAFSFLFIYEIEVLVYGPERYFVTRTQRVGQVGSTQLEPASVSGSRGSGVVGGVLARTAGLADVGGWGNTWGDTWGD